MDYRQAIEYMWTYPDWERGTTSPRGQIMSLDAVRGLLARLGNPQLGRKTAHIAGSKGKGSTSTMLTAILQASGQRTALFTSPRLHSYTEQIAFDLQPVSEAEFASGVEAMKAMVEAEHESAQGPVATFGIVCALYFFLCGRRNGVVDWQIVEVGLGGKDDATNVFEHKELAVITPISLEHTAILGKTHAEIAAIKGGIITPGCTTVLSPQHDASVKPVIARRCQEVGAQLIAVDEHYQIAPLSCDAQSQTFELNGPRGRRQLRLSMLGKHQLVNATTAVAAAESLLDRGLIADDQSWAAALEHVAVPGRFEIIQRDPTLVVDGAHNGESAAALCSALKDHLRTSNCIFVLGVNGDKDIGAICAQLAPIAKRVIATKSKNPKAMDPEKIASACRALGVISDTADTVAEAISKALLVAQSDDVICATGSLYVVAEARECSGYQ